MLQGCAFDLGESDEVVEEARRLLEDSLRLEAVRAGGLAEQHKQWLRIGLGSRVQQCSCEPNKKSVER